VESNDSSEIPDRRRTYILDIHGPPFVGCIKGSRLILLSTVFWSAKILPLQDIGHNEFAKVPYVMVSYSSVHYQQNHLLKQSSIYYNLHRKCTSGGVYVCTLSLLACQVKVKLPNVTQVFV